jgi:hypothetical protein
VDDGGFCGGWRLILRNERTLFIRFSTFSLWRGFSSARIFFSSRTPKPSSSRPIRASQEPGENGVSRANRPISISTTPKIFFAIVFIYNGYVDSSRLTPAAMLYLCYNIIAKRTVVSRVGVT